MYILIKQKAAEENSTQTQEGNNIPFRTYVLRGELVSQIPAKDRIPRKDGSPSHNYCVHNDPATTLYDDGTGVCPLQGAELDYLLAIQSPTTRLIQYHKPGKMKWIVDLRIKDIVFFKLNLVKIKGKVRFYGLVKGHYGVMFGIEILVSVQLL